MNIEMIKAALSFTFKSESKIGKFKGKIVDKKLSLKSEPESGHFACMKEMQIEDAIEYFKSVKDKDALEKAIKQAIVSHFRKEIEFSTIAEYENAKLEKNLGEKWHTNNGWSAYEYLEIPVFFNIK
jgi:hypothetical protein